LAGDLFIISAPSGSGKSTLVNRLRLLVTNLEFSVSYTTRAPRGTEQQDREYHYISRTRFQEMIQQGEFLEYAGKDLLLDIDVQGAAQVRNKVRDAVSIFVLPPNPDTLAQRLRERSRLEGSVLEDEINKRLAKARTEIENYRQYRYIIVNDLLDDAVDALTAIVVAERARRQGAPPDPETARMMHLADKCRQANIIDRLYPVLSSFGVLDMHATRV